MVAMERWLKVWPRFQANWKFGRVLLVFRRWKIIELLCKLWNQLSKIIDTFRSRMTTVPQDVKQGERSIFSLSVKGGSMRTRLSITILCLAMLVSCQPGQGTATDLPTPPNDTTPTKKILPPELFSPWKQKTAHPPSKSTQESNTPTKTPQEAPQGVIF